VLVNGQSMEGDRDYYRFTARAGQTLICRADARALQPFIADAVPGWNDAVLTLFDSAGRQVATVDDVGFQPDPVLTCRIPSDGEYLLEIRDILFRGRADFVYRLSIGFDAANAGPVAKHSPDAAVVESEPNEHSASARVLALPALISGRIDRPGDVDEFPIRAKAGQKLVAEIHARRLGSPLDASIAIFNAAGKKLAENDDTVDLSEPLLTHHADPRLLLTFPRDGRYTLRLRDVQGKGGAAYTYRLKVAEPQPDYELRVAPDNPRLNKGDNVALTITAIRKDGFAAPVDLHVAGLPPGFIVSPATIPPGQTVAMLTITAPEDASPALLCPTVRGEAKIADTVLSRNAIPAEQVMQAFSYTHIMPTQELALAVVESSPLRLSIDRPATAIDIPQAGSAEVRLKILRGDGPRTGIALKGAGLPRGLTIRPGFIPPDKDEALITINATRQVPAGLIHNLVITATSRSGKESVTRTLPAVPIRIIAAAKNKP
jgi:hypothetical protein